MTSKDFRILILYIRDGNLMIRFKSLVVLNSWRVPMTKNSFTKLYRECRASLLRRLILFDDSGRRLFPTFEPPRLSQRSEPRPFLDSTKTEPYPNMETQVSNILQFCLK
jgi:hypothetical protein